MYSLMIVALCFRIISTQGMKHAIHTYRASSVQIGRRGGWGKEEKEEGGGGEGMKE